MKSGRYQIGIIGAGFRGINAFGKILAGRSDAEVAALCDPNPIRMEYAAKELGLAPHSFTSVEAMLAAERLDAVVITSPDYCHVENAVAAIGRGVNVLLDKPLATTVKGCRTIIEAARKADRIVMMGFNLRHHTVLKKLKELVASGALGRVFLIENREFYDGGRTYMSRWNRHYAKCGGLWVHKGSHDFDVFNWLLDFPKPVRVSAVAGIDAFTPDRIPFPVKPGVPVGPTCHQCAYRTTCPDVYAIDDIQNSAWGDRAVAADGYSKDLCMYTSDKDVHDNGIAIVEYENGAKASHMECFVTSDQDRLFTVVGDRGMAEASLEKRTITVKPRWSREIITHTLPEVVGGHGGADPTLVDSFMKALKGEVQNASTVEHGLWSTAIGQAAEIARRESRVVKVAELFETV